MLFEIFNIAQNLGINSLLWQCRFTFITFPLPNNLARKCILDSYSLFAGRKELQKFSATSVEKNKHISPHHTPPSPGAQHLQGYTALNRSEMVYLRKCKTGFCAITTTQGRLCSLTIQAIYSQPATMQAQGLSSAGVQWHLSDLSTIGCRAWEASLSNIL